MVLNLFHTIISFMYQMLAMIPFLKPSTKIHLAVRSVVHAGLVDWEPEPAFYSPTFQRHMTQSEYWEAFRAKNLKEVDDEDPMAAEEERNEIVVPSNNDEYEGDGGDEPSSQ